MLSSLPTGGDTFDDVVRDYIAREIEATGVNYYVCDFAFGTISHDEALRSVELFTREVMPAFADA